MLSKKKDSITCKDGPKPQEKKTKDLNLDHIISHSSYNDDFHADFLAKSFVRKMVVFSVYGV